MTGPAADVVARRMMSNHIMGMSNPTGLSTTRNADYGIFNILTFHFILHLY